MQEFKKISDLVSAANEIFSLFKTKIPKWQKDRSHYDKVRYGFEQGTNDGWYKGAEITIHFGAWCGTYGNSSTYKEFKMDGDIFKKHFMGYLNSHKESIMMSIHDSILIEAKALKDLAEKEVENQKKILDSL